MQRGISFFNKLFALIPLGMSGLLAAVYMLGGWSVVNPKYTPEHFYLPKLQLDTLLLSIVIIASLFVAIYFCGNMLKTKKGQGLALSTAAIFGVAILARLILIFIFKDYLIPFSDFERIWGIAHGNIQGNIEYYQLFPTYLNYAVLQKNIIHLLGDSYINILYTNVVLGGIIAVVVSLTAYEVSNSIQVAFISGMLYSLMPSNILYTAIGGPDLLTICLNSLALLCVVASFKRGWKASAAGSVVAGILFGLGASYKSFAIIIIIALIMVYSARWICEEKSEHGANKTRLKSLALLCTCFALVIISYSGAKAVVINQTEKEFDVKLDMGTSTPHFLLVGLNTQGEGQISNGNLSREYYQFYLDNGQDLQGAKQHAYSLLKKDWHENKREVPKLFIIKTVWAWQDDVIPATYMENCIAETGKLTHPGLYSWLIKTAPEASQAYYFMLMLLSFGGIVNYIRKKKVNYDIEFIELVIFGYFCLLMLSEAQSRYKCLIMPYMCILSTMGIITIMNTIAERKKTLHG